MHTAVVAYILAPFNTNECIAPSMRITDLATCRAAAAMLGRSVSGSGVFATAPRGCYCTASVYMYFNGHATGAAAADKQPVCVVTGTFSPTNLGDTNPPTFAPTAWPTRSPTTASPTRLPTTASPTRSPTAVPTFDASGKHRPWPYLSCVLIRERVCLHVRTRGCGSGV